MKKQKKKKPPDRNNKEMTAAERQQILIAHNAGANVNTLRNKFRRGYHVIAKILSEKPKSMENVESTVSTGTPEKHVTEPAKRRGKRNYSKMTDQERASIIEERKAGLGIMALAKKFRRSSGVIHEVSDEAIKKRRAKRTALVPISASLEKFNKTLDESVSVSNVLDGELSRLIEKVRAMLPTAQTIVVDLVNLRAKIHLAQEIDLLVGGVK